MEEYEELPHQKKIEPGCNGKSTDSPGVSASIDITLLCF